MSEMMQGVFSKVGGLKEGAATVCASFQGFFRMSGVEFANCRLFASLVMEVNPKKALL